MFRSLRRASDTRSITCRDSSNEINAVNRGKRVKGTTGKQVSGPMTQHYTEFLCLVKPFYDAIELFREPLGLC